MSFKKSVLFFSIMVLFLTPFSQAQEPDWSEGFIVPPGGRPNPYYLEPETFLYNQKKGKLHAQIYPVSVTGILVPERPLRKFIEDTASNPFKKLVQKLFRDFANVNDFNDLFAWVGLNPYPLEEDSGVYSVPYPNDVRPEHLLGYGEIERNGAVGFTISCAECHSSRLFGKTVLGLSNRFPRANETFIKAKQLMPWLNIKAFQWYHKATDEEAQMLKETKTNLKSVAVKKPLQLGLDTSLAQVALSLNKRKSDPYATKSKWARVSPKKDWLDDYPADSKPAVWWNLKYKNKFLSDGSVVSGNPIYTNLLWNEIGRGADLNLLENWLLNNQDVIRELTTAVFSSEAPHITDFFSEDKIPLVAAQRGQELFEQSCSKCHGYYIKNWQRADADTLSSKEILKTWRVVYPEDTPIKDVGTDPYRRWGMRSLEKLNDLAISKTIGTRVKAQPGYVPPPLEGIWARWPYLHNNSVPSLCALLTPANRRPKTYYAGPAENPETDFDFECNGYPNSEHVPQNWKKKEYFYNTQKPGLSNQGHEKMLFNDLGEERFSARDKKNLIYFLQTL